MFDGGAAQAIDNMMKITIIKILIIRWTEGERFRKREVEVEGGREWNPIELPSSDLEISKRI